MPLSPKNTPTPSPLAAQYNSHLLYAREHMDRGDIESVIQTCTDILQDNPNNMEANFAMMEISAQYEMWNEVLYYGHHIDQTYVPEEKRIQVVCLTIEALMECKNFRQAKRMLEPLFLLKKGNDYVAFLVAKFRDCVRESEDMISLDQDQNITSTDALIEADYKQALCANPGSEKYVMQYAQYLIKKELKEEACALLSDAPITPIRRRILDRINDEIVESEQRKMTALEEAAIKPDIEQIQSLYLQREILQAWQHLYDLTRKYPDNRVLLYALQAMTNQLAEYKTFIHQFDKQKI